MDNFEKLSRLAQIAFSPEESRACQADLKHMIDMIDSMNRVDTEGVEPLTHPLDANQRLRPDEVTEQDQRAEFQDLAPQTEKGLYLVPRVLE